MVSLPSLILPVTFGRYDSNPRAGAGEHTGVERRVDFLHSLYSVEGSRDDSNSL